MSVAGERIRRLSSEAGVIVRVFIIALISQELLRKVHSIFSFIYRPFHARETFKFAKMFFCLAVSESPKYLTPLLAKALDVM